MLHGNLRNANTPKLVRKREIHLAQSVGLHVFGRSQLAKVAPWIDGHDAHPAQKATDTLGTDKVTQNSEIIDHPQNDFRVMR